MPNNEEKSKCPYCNLDMEWKPEYRQLFDWHLGGHPSKNPIEEKQYCGWCDQKGHLDACPDNPKNTPSTYQEEWEKEFDEKFKWLLKDSITAFGPHGRQERLNVELTRKELLDFIEVRVQESYLNGANDGHINGREVERSRIIKLVEGIKDEYKNDENAFNNGLKAMKSDVLSAINES